MKPVPLQRVNYHSRLRCVLEISECKVDLLAVLSLPRNESEASEPLERSEYMRNLSIAGVVGETLNIHSASGVLRYRQVAFEILTQSSELFYYVGRDLWLQ